MPHDGGIDEDAIMAQSLILVVEDEGIVGLDIQRRLSNMGYAVPEVAATGKQAVQRALKLQPQLVLMDIRLKGEMDGISAAEQIRKLLDIPVIFLTAYADQDTLQRAKVTEPYGYVLKPFEERELHIAIDMALYKHAMERKLKQSEHWLATTISSLNDAIITTDADGQITLLNPTAIALTGWSHEDAIGKPLHEILCVLDESTRTRDANLLATLLSKPTNHSLDLTGLLVSRMGDEIPIQYHVAPIRDAADQTLGAVIVFRDVTEQRRREQESLRVQKLESLGLMAGGVAHDFNNLLSVVVNNLTLLKMRLNPQDEVYRRLELLEKSLWRGAELTQQLLTFAKGGAPVRKPTNIAALLHEAADLALSGSAVHPNFRLAQDLWPAEVDVGQMGHALHNLFLNAKEAMPTGGQIEIYAENTHLIAEQNPPLKSGNYVWIALRDYGAGIAPENLGHVFDPYFTTKPHGSGLGLATVHSIVKRHEGHITVDSAPGVGTTFSIYLPAVEQPSDQQEPARPETLMTGKGRILLMDDEDLIREATGALLEHLGYTYACASDGAEAVALYREAMTTGQRFDVVILDLTVPGGMGGQEALALLQTMDPAVKAIVSSGYFHDPIVANYQSHGFSGVVSKPYTIEEMSDTLHRLIQFDAAAKRT
jgi:two-component system cell cycle sensor histidine kinase/response regulator CckA